MAREGDLKTENADRFIPIDPALLEMLAEAMEYDEGEPEDYIVDYIVLVTYLMKCLGFTKTEIRKLILDFKNCYVEARIRSSTRCITETFLVY